MRKVPLSITIPADLRTWLDQRAEADDRSLSSVVTVILRQARDTEADK